jgi:TonB family protein
MPTSSLDEGLPGRPFAEWFRNLTGPEAGILWQLTECGDPVGSDLLACTEANAVLPNGNKVVVAVTVGTFKRGMTGQPAFFRAVIERDNQLYQVRRLRSLPEMVRLAQKLLFVAPEISPESQLPGLYSDSLKNLSLGVPARALPSHSEYHTPIKFNLDLDPEILAEVEERPNLVPAERPLHKLTEGEIRGIARKKVMPEYPRFALDANAAGRVELQIIVSEEGRVIEAAVMSGDPLLRSAALDAARRWVFRPTVINGIRVKVQSTLTLLFDPVNQ